MINTAKTNQEIPLKLSTKLIKEGGKQTPERFKINIAEEINYIVATWILSFASICLWKTGAYILFTCCLNPESYNYYEPAGTLLIPALQFLDHLISTTLKGIFYLTHVAFFLLPFIAAYKDKKKSIIATEEK